jgi:hypothetical protein
MTELKLYQGRKPVPVKMATLFEVYKAVTAAGKEAEFLKAAQDANASLHAQPETVNAVKSFLHAHKLHERNATIAHIVSPDAKAPGCFG